MTNVELTRISKEENLGLKCLNDRTNCTTRCHFCSNVPACLTNLLHVFCCLPVNTATLVIETEPSAFLIVRALSMVEDRLNGLSCLYHTNEMKWHLLLYFNKLSTLTYSANPIAYSDLFKAWFCRFKVLKRLTSNRAVSFDAVPSPLGISVLCCCCFKKSSFRSFQLLKVFVFYVYKYKFHWSIVWLKVTRK